MHEAKLQVRQYPKLIEEFARENFNLKTLNRSTRSRSRF